MLNKINLVCLQTYDQNYAKMLETMKVKPEDVAEGLQVLLYSFYAIGFSEGGKNALTESGKIFSQAFKTGK